MNSTHDLADTLIDALRWHRKEVSGDYPNQEIPLWLIALTVWKAYGMPGAGEGTGDFEALREVGRRAVLDEGSPRDFAAPERLMMEEHLGGWSDVSPSDNWLAFLGFMALAAESFLREAKEN